MNNFSTLQSTELTDWHLAHRLMSIAFVMRIQGDEQYIEMELNLARPIWSASGLKASLWYRHRFYTYTINSVVVVVVVIMDCFLWVAFMAIACTP
jgi:hypothetical protein